MRNPPSFVLIFFIVAFFIVCITPVRGFDPASASDWYNEGLRLGDNGRYQEALEAFITARSMDPRYYEQYYGISYEIGWLLAKLGRYEEALDQFNISLYYHPPWKNEYAPHYNKGWVLARMGRYQEALQEFDKALIISPDNYMVLFNEAWVLGKLGAYGEAADTYQKSLRCQKFGYGYLDFFGTYQDAVIAYDKAQGMPASLPEGEKSPPPRRPSQQDTGQEEQINESEILRWDLKAWDYIQQNRYEDALDAYDRVLMKEPYNDNAMFYKGYALIKLGRYEEAVELLNHTLLYVDKNSKESRYISIMNTKGLALGILGNYEEANRCFDNALAWEPDAYYIWFNKGYALAQMGRYWEAASAYNRSLDWTHRETEHDVNSFLGPLGSYQDAATIYQLAAQQGEVPEEKLGPLHKKYRTIYITDFSQDPHWQTNMPRDYHWDEPRKMFYYQGNNQGGYAEYILPEPPGPFLLEFDLIPLHADSGSSVRVGLSEYNRTLSGQNAVFAELKNGNIGLFYAIKSGDKTFSVHAINRNSMENYNLNFINRYYTSDKNDFGKDVIYHVMIIYDSRERIVLFRVTDNHHPQDYYVSSYILSDLKTRNKNVGIIENLYRIILVTEKEKTGYSEGYIDNVVVLVPDDSVPLFQQKEETPSPVPQEPTVTAALPGEAPGEKPPSARAAVTPALAAAGLGIFTVFSRKRE